MSHRSRLDGPTRNRHETDTKPTSRLDGPPDGRKPRRLHLDGPVVVGDAAGGRLDRRNLDGPTAVVLALS